MSSNNAKIQKEIASALGDVRVCIQTPYVRKHGKTQEEVNHVTQDLVIFLSLRGDGAHYRDARAWHHTKMTKLPNPSLWFLQLLLLVAERPEDGSLHPRTDRFSNPKGYMDAVNLAARVMSSDIPNPIDKKMLTKLLVSDFYVDMRFLHEVQERAKQCKSERAAKVTNANQAGAGRKKGARQPPQEREASPPPPPPPPLNPERVAHYSDGGIQWARRFSLFVDHSNHVVTEVINAIDPEWEDAFSQSVAGGVGASAAAAAAASGADAATPYNGPEWIPKFDFAVSSVPDKEGEIMGIIVRFMIHDPSINVMEFFTRMVENARQRALKQVSGGGKGRPAAFGEKKEMFPSYSGLYYSQHPVATNTSYEMYMDCALRQCPDIMEGTTRDELSAHLNLRSSSIAENRVHIARILTMKNALEQALKSGADPVALGRLSDWTTGNGTARFPLETYRYRPEQLFWKKDPLIGMSEQYFPHISADDDLTASLMLGKSLDRWLPDGTIDPEYREEEDPEMQSLEMRNAMDQARMIIENNTLVNRHDIMNNRLVYYDTPNALIHRAAEAERIQKNVEQKRPTHYTQTQEDVMAVMFDYRAGENWRAILETKEEQVELFLKDHIKGKPTAKRILLMRRGLSLKERVKECDSFNGIMELSRQSRLKIFSTLWLVEGEVDDLPVPESLRAIMRWFRERRSGTKDTRIPHLTRQFMMFDPEMGIFGNSMIRQVKMFTCVGLILQPLICMLTEGLFSCFRYSPKKLAFNLLFHGRYDTGKSHAAINILMKLICIEGTVLPYVSQTKAADTTLRHYYDLIIASDEVPQRKVSQAEAEKDPEATNKDKLKMTDRFVGVNVFTFETDPSTGEKVRWARTFRTDHYVALVEVTNHVVEATSALASRYFRLTVAQPRLEARKLQNESHVSALLKGDMVGYLNTNQYLSACIYKAIQCGVMQEPFMGLFWDTANRILDCLQANNAISKDTGARGLEIMMPYAIQMVIHWAIHCAFDLPSSPNYMKGFTPECIKEVEPYLYCTVEIVWWCWTALASGWIEEMSGNVINSAVRSFGLDMWGSTAEGLTPYHMWELDINNRIPWRRRRNEQNEKDPLIDLQYVTFYGTKEQIARQIASKSDPKLDWTDVISVFNQLAGKMVPVPWNVYRPMPLSGMKAWHQFIQLPREVISVPGTATTHEMRDFTLGVKNIPPVGQYFPAEYCISNSDVAKQRTEEDMPRVGPNQLLPAVDMSDVGKQMIHIMPWVVDYFSSERVIEALVYATTCAGTRTNHKMLLGMHLANDQQNFKTQRYTPESLESMIVEMDSKIGWAEDGKTWLGNPHIPPEKRIPSRRQGIAIDRPAALTKADSIYFTSVSAAPTNMSSEDWRSKSEADTSMMQEVRQTHYDLDFASARAQHCRSGQPLDAPVKTPLWIEQEYKRHCALIGRPWTENVDYPHETVSDNTENQSYWTSLDQIRAMTSAMPVLAKIRAAANMPREKRQATTAPAADAATAAPTDNRRRKVLSRPTVSDKQQSLLNQLQ